MAGALFAFTALIAWGVGDFLIQKSTRKFGDWLAIFYIASFSVVALLPFVYKDLGQLFHNGRSLIFLLGVSVVILFAALFDFEALKRGKLSIIEPINALELPVAVALATFILGEPISVQQTIFIAVLIAGIALLSIKSFHNLKKIHLERGVRFAFVATLAMGTTNFLFGVGGRAIGPLMINWFTDLFLTIVVLGYLIYKAKLRDINNDWKRNKKLILGVAVLDNTAWIAYTYSMLYIPIAISTGISESYIALSAILGLTLNKEKLKSHQWAGFGACIVAAIFLAFTVSS